MLREYLKGMFRAKFKSKISRVIVDNENNIYNGLPRPK
jgi:hypothetical protein